MPHTGIEDRRIARLHDDFRTGRLVIDEKHAAPGLAAVGGLVHAALLVRSEKMPHNGHPHDVRVPRVHDDPGDVPAVFQSQVVPAASAIVAAPDTTQVFGDVVPQCALSFTCIYDGLIGWRNGYGPDAAAEESVRDVLPVTSAIGSLPEASPGSSEIKGVLIGEAATDGIGPAATERPDQPVLQRGKKGRVSVARMRDGRGFSLGGQ